MEIIMNKKLIISRYNEDISWIKNYPYDYIIYNKGDKMSDEYNHIDVDNIGNNQRDIFQFIYDNYDNLPDVMAFVQGNVYEHCNQIKFDKIIGNNTFTSLESYEDIVINSAQKLDSSGGYMEINNSWYINAHNASRGQSCLYDSFDSFMHGIFTNYIKSDWNRFAPGSQYIITKEIAKFYSRNFWKFLMDILNKNGMTEGHIIERSLWMIFQCYLIPIDQLK